jgi:hypothetical protein
MDKSAPLMLFKVRPWGTEYYRYVISTSVAQAALDFQAQGERRSAQQVEFLGYAHDLVGADRLTTPSHATGGDQ